MADVQRPGRVGGDVFEQDFLWVFGGVAAKGVAFAHDVCQDGAVAAALKADVDEAGACDFEGGDAGDFRQGGDEGFGELARVHAEGFGVLHGDVGGVVAVRGVFAAAKFRGLGELLQVNLLFLCDGVQSGSQASQDAGFHGFSRGRSVWVVSALF